MWDSSTNFVRQFEHETCFCEICIQTEIVTGDELWIYSYDPETTQQSLEWKSPNSLWLKKGLQVHSHVKSMLIGFLTFTGLAKRNSYQAICVKFY